MCHEWSERMKAYSYSNTIGSVKVKQLIKTSDIK
jgi:hypothetical protein